MATVTTQRPEPEPVEPTYVLTLSQDEALELAGLLGRGYSRLVGDVYWDLDDALSREVNSHLDHPSYKAGENARISPPVEE